MHLLRSFLVVWIEFGIVTVFFLYWLAKRTARHINRLDKPVLGQDSFQQLLAAAYALQEQNRYPVKEVKADSSRTVSLPLESAPIAHHDVQPLASLNYSAVPSFRDRWPPRSDEFFWRVARAVAMAAVFALLLVSSTDRLSPLPAGLVVQQQEPLRRVVSKAIVKRPQATKTGPNQRTVDAGKTGKSKSTSARKRNPARHSIYESEADMVAPDTVMHYGRRPSVPH
jgi:hypothetical protein